MKVEELMEMKVTFPKGKDRWDLIRRKVLDAAIRTCLETGMAQVFERDGILFRIFPEYPLVESAMQEPRNASLLKVRIQVWTQRYSLGVRA